MKTSKVILALTALVLAAAMLLSACGVKDDSKTTAAGTSSAGEPAMTEEPATEEPTTAKPKYSPSDKLIALTFDDGPRSSTTNRVLDLLERSGGVATFFLVGYNIPDNAEVIKRAAAMGCSIGNHTKDHKILTKCSADTIKAQVNGVNSLLRDMGVEPTLFRAPGGAFKGVKDQIGMPLIQWSIDTEDWKFKDASHKGRSAEERTADLNRIADMVFSQAKGGSIVLMHDIYDFTADLCEIVIPGLVERGFKLVTVDQLFEAYGEKLENGVVYYSAKLPEPSARPASAEPIAAGKYTVSTSGSVLNMRVSPDADSQVLEKIPNGTIVEVTKSVLGWAYVTYNSAQGWVSSAYLV
ncbi:MAG: polysaccharide deacetylase family protein [Oscillospiraceae bacterium]|nr:polysaccharide deacetylase family protein [Oscillospiraceae bacterium]